MALFQQNLLVLRLLEVVIRLAQVGVESRVLDSDRGLVGEPREHLKVRLAEDVGRAVRIDVEHAEISIAPEDRDADG